MVRLLLYMVYLVYDFCMTLKDYIKKSYMIFVYIVIIFVAGTSGFFIGKHTNTANTIVSVPQAIRENDTTYKFIHPLLAVGRTNLDVPSSGYSNVFKMVQDYINSEKSEGQLIDTSVYFSDYKVKGGSFVINENDAYVPASMLKIVIMIGYLKKSDSDSSILSKTFTYNSSFASSMQDLPFESPTQLKIGQSYTVNDLIHRMIVDSDNGAMNVLLANIDDNYLSQVYKDLGLTEPTDS